MHPSDEMYGADRVLIEIVDVLSERCDPQIWLPDDLEYPLRELTSALEGAGRPVERQSIPVLRRDYLRPGGVVPLGRRAFATWTRLREVRPDLVYLNTSATLSVAPLAHASGARVIAHLHESWTRRERALLGPLLRFCDDVVTVSGAVSATLPRGGQRSTVVHNGFAIEAGDVNAGVVQRSAIGVGPDDVVVLLASRWNAWKGHEALLRAWAGLERADLHLVVLGGPPPSGGVVDVRALVGQLPRSDSVTIIGETSDVAGWIEAADVVVVPSTRPDPLPTIAIEAMAHGRAVLASCSGGLPEIVEHGVTGSLLPAGDEHAWRSALTSLDIASLRAQGVRGRSRYEAEFALLAFRRNLGGVVDLALDKLPTRTRA